MIITPNRSPYAGSDCSVLLSQGEIQADHQRASPMRIDLASHSLSCGLLNTPVSVYSNPSEYVLNENSSQWSSSSVPQSTQNYEMSNEALASTDLQLQLGQSTTIPWGDRYGIAAGHMDIRSSLSDYHARTDINLQFSSIDHEQSTSMPFGQPVELGYDEPALLGSPATGSRAPSVAVAKSNASSSAENKFYDDFEPCHFAIGEDDEISSRFTAMLPTTNAMVSEGYYSERAGAGSSDIKYEDSDSGENSNTVDTNSSSDDLDYNECVKDGSPEPRRQKTTYEAARYICGFCGKPFTRSFNFNTHMETHDPNRKKPYQCKYPTCFKTFYRPTDLKRHDQSVHVKSKEFICDQCGAGFPRKDSLQRHKTDGCARRPKVKTSKTSQKRKQHARAMRKSDLKDTAPQKASFNMPLEYTGYMSNAEALRLARRKSEIGAEACFQGDSNLPIQQTKEASPRLHFSSSLFS